MSEFNHAPLGELIEIDGDRTFAIEAAADPEANLGSRAWNNLDGLYVPIDTRQRHQALVINPLRDDILGVIGAWSTSIRDGEKAPDGRGAYGYELAEIGLRNPDMTIAAPQKHGEKGAPILTDVQREQLRDEGRYVEIGYGLIRAFEQKGTVPTALFGISEGAREVLGVAATGSLKGRLKTVIMVDPVGVEDMGRPKLAKGFALTEGGHQAKYLDLESADPEQKDIMTRHGLIKGTSKMIGRWAAQGSLRDQAGARIKALSQGGLEADLHDALANNPDLKIVWVTAEHSAVAKQEKVIEIYSHLPESLKRRVTLLNAPDATHSLTQAHAHRVAASIPVLLSAAA